MHNNGNDDLNEQERNALAALLYFNIFNHPLLANEVFSFSRISTSNSKQLLDGLVAKGLLFCFDGYYTIQNNEELIKRRLAGNEKAIDAMKKAYKYGGLISQFPFVKCVCVSGSLSKNYIDEKGDIDYFIITQPGRLWIARTLLILYKKAVLFNSHKFFCLNYFIDTNHLEIADKNIFTATEILTLKPLEGIAVFNNFIQQNGWVTNYLPNYKLVETLAKNEIKSINWIERLLNNNMGDWLDSFCMKLTLKKWRVKFKGLSKTEFELAMRTRKYVSKHHPQNFQQKVLDELEKAKTSFQKNNNVVLHD